MLAGLTRQNLTIQCRCRRYDEDAKFEPALNNVNGEFVHIALRQGLENQNLSANQLSRRRDILRATGVPRTEASLRVQERNPRKAIRLSTIERLARPELSSLKQQKQPRHHTALREA